MTDDTTQDHAGTTPFPNLASDWSGAEAAHPAYVTLGVDDTPGRKAYFIHREAKPGREAALEAFLRDINAGVDAEPDTGPWFGLRYSRSTHFIFEAFPDADARHAHDGGPGGTNFTRADELEEILAAPARLYRLDVLHGKFTTMFGETVAPERDPHLAVDPDRR